MAVTSLSYVGRDVSEIRRELIDMIPTLTSKWTDFNSSDIGITLIELIASVQDMQNFYFDTQAYETYLDTAVQPKNIRSLVRAMNYRLPLICAARGTLRITFEDNSYREVRIPKYTLVGSTFSDISQKYSVSDTVIANGIYSHIDVPIVEGEVRSLKVTKGELRSNLTSSGNVSRRVYLGYTNVADRTVEILQNGVLWEECDDAIMKYRGGYYYSVHKDSEGQVYVLMSVDFLDRLPVADDEVVEFKFITTSGIDGQVTADSLNYIETPLSGVTEITNVYSTYGAADEVNLDKLKLLAREKAVTMDRYVTLEDYANGVATENYVRDSVVKDWKYPEYVSDPYTVKVWAVDSWGQTIGSEVIKSLKEKFNKKGVLDINVIFMPVENVNFSVDVCISLKAMSVSDKERVRDSVEQALKIYFQGDTMCFGYSVTYQQIYSTVMSASNKIKKAIIMSPATDISLTEIQFPILDSISVRIVDDL